MVLTNGCWLRNTKVFFVGSANEAFYKIVLIAVIKFIFNPHNLSGYNLKS